MNTNKVIPILKSNDDSTEDMFTSMDDKHIASLKTLLYSDIGQVAVPSDYKYDYAINKKTKIIFALMPKWAIYMPPYGIARLASVCKEAGYETLAFDFNVEAYHELGEMSDDLYGVDGQNDFKWLENEYKNRVEKYLTPLIEQWADIILAHQPDVVGLSLYYTNVIPSIQLAKILKQKLPSVKVIVGGSQINSKWDSGIYANIDHALRGEGEELILEFLDKIENNIPITEYLIEANSERRVNIDQLPFPDYSHFDLNKYLIKNAISTEISRGCVAKCTFCDETFFWRFRSRGSGGIIEEIEHQYTNYGTRKIWFLDSLVNGNLKELHAFALEVIKRELNLQWQGYARADKRMDFNFYKDLKESGCLHLNYGVESGSQVVLDSMKKNITPEIIENNIRDGHRAGLSNMTQWMLGYPNEGINDIAKTFTLIWRIHWYDVLHISRTSCMLGPNTRLLKNIDKFNIAKAFTREGDPTPKRFLNQWYSNDFKNTKLHRLIRYKSINILCLELPRYKHFDKNKIENYSKQYSVIYNHPIDPTADVENYQDVTYEDFDYEVIKDPKLVTKFHSTLVNEVFALIRTLWRAHKKHGMSISIKFDSDWDLNEFGDYLASEYFNAEYHFEINDAGDWDLNAKVTLNITDNPYHPWMIETTDFLDYNLDLNYVGSGSWC